MPSTLQSWYKYNFYHCIRHPTSTLYSMSISDFPVYYSIKNAHKLETVVEIFEEPSVNQISNPKWLIRTLLCLQVTVNLLSNTSFTHREFMVTMVLSRCTPNKCNRLPFVLKHSITQVIDLLEGLRCLALPLLCERIVEVPLREWTVAPALQKDGSYCIRKPPVLSGDVLQQEREEAAVVTSHDGDVKSNEDDGKFVSIHAEGLDSTLNSSEPATQSRQNFGSVPYIARPHPEQMSHTGKILVSIFMVLQSVNSNNLDLLLLPQHSWSN